MINLASRSILFILPSDFFYAAKSFELEPPALFPSEGGLRIFIALKNSHPRSGLNPRTLGLMATTLTITHRGVKIYFKFNLLTPPWSSSGRFRKDILYTHILRVALLIATGYSSRVKAAVADW
jgi:hypothetical protein